MSSADFNFLPRKLAGNSSGKLRSRPSIAIASSSRNVADSVPVYAVRDEVLEIHEDRKTGGKLKDPYLKDDEYADLLILALSDHAIWSSPDLQELMNTDENGFVPLRYVVYSSPVFAGLTRMPSESTLVRCIKDTKLLERRIIIGGPSRAQGGETGGGYEVRRADWETLQDRIRKYTSFQWETRSIYIENLPPYAKSISTVYQFVSALLEANGSLKKSYPAIQCVSFPPHRDNKPGDPPTRNKGFAFIVLSQSKDAEFLQHRWPWAFGGRPTNLNDDSSQAVADATDFGFRCLSRKEWAKLKEEYLALQQRLLDEAMAANKPSRPSRSTGDVRDPLEEPHSPPRDRANAVASPCNPPFPPRLPATFPHDCLVFVRNIHPDTNKTTLRTLFSASMGCKGDDIDYVDYNKGLDSCYLRLVAPQHALTLVSHFSANKVSQMTGLDNEGSPTLVGTSASIEVELVQGKKEEMYWGKVPEKVRKQALARLQTPGNRMPLEDQAENDGKRKHKRRKRA